MQKNRVKGLVSAMVSSATFGLIPLFSLPAMKAGILTQSVLIYRFGIGSIFILLGMALMRVSPKITWSQFWRIAVLAFFSMAGAVTLVYGYNFIEELMTPEIMDDMMRDLPMEPDADSVETREYLFAQYVINRYITEVERKELLSRIGQRYTFDLYTPNKDFSMPGCRNHGSVDVYEGACRVFKNSKINLNITLRSIITGIPLRAFEILGSGGFLLTNYQADFDDCYTAFEDYVYFEDPDDMMTKIEFYLSHEKERREIAANGLRKTLENHTFEQRVRTIAEILSGKNI